MSMSIFRTSLLVTPPYLEDIGYDVVHIYAHVDVNIHTPIDVHRNTQKHKHQCTYVCAHLHAHRYVLMTQKHTYTIGKHKKSHLRICIYAYIQ